MTNRKDVLPSFGSSPRTRGTGKSDASSPSANRFIPADAGNSRSAASSYRPSSVHPRGRGEQRPHPNCQGQGCGSSPRTRGTGAPKSHKRTLPAVHPRGRGEQCPFSLRARSMAGSSPRTRGTDAQVYKVAVGARFIPADAGNSNFSDVKAIALSVHPRGRGEQDIRIARVTAGFGSSPRTRGTGQPAVYRLRCPGFIPADAGNSI